MIKINAIVPFPCGTIESSAFAIKITFLVKPLEFATLVELMAKNDDVVQKIGNLIDQKLEPVKNDLRDVKQDMHSLKQAQAQTNANLEQTNTTLGHVKTLVEAVAAGQKELQETVATRADVLDVGIKIDKVKKRIDTLEEDAGITHKN